MDITNLNQEQLLAATTIEGPVIVNASPGTGKTQILAVRSGLIVEESGVNPANILNLTFSNAGMVAMKKRLVKLFGPIGHRFHVYTFHALANKILQENTDIIGVRDIEPASAMQIVMIIRQIIDELPITNSLKRLSGDIYFEETRMKDLFHTMKSENWTPENVIDKIDEYLDDLPNREEFIYKRKSGNNQKGDVKQASIDAEVEKMKMLKDAAMCLPVYNNKLREQGLYDYDDMLGLVTEAFDKNEWLLRRYQEQYLYVQVDEFQDTNGIQMKLITQLTKYWGDQANIFGVGDDDQALYEFQGARLANMVDFIKKYPTVTIVTLDKNYRSEQNILDVASLVVENNEDRLTKVLNLVKSPKAMRFVPDGRSHVHLREFDNRSEEYAWIVHQLKKIKNLNEVAIIYSKHKQVEDMIKLLVNNGIPYTSSRSVNALETGVWRMLWALLKIAFAKNPEVLDSWFYQIAAFPFIPGHKGLLKDIVDKRIVDYNDTAINIALENKEFSEYYFEMREVAATETFHDALDKIIYKSGLAKYCHGNVMKTQTLISIFRFIKAYSLDNAYMTFDDLDSYLKAMIHNNIPLPVEIIMKDQSGVNLMTSHASKGLEFKTVFMIDASQTWEPSKNNQGKYSLPDTLIYSKNDTTMEAARRAFFVALTRGEKDVYVTYSNQILGKDSLRCQFVDEMEIQAEVVKPTKIKGKTLTEIYFNEYFNGMSIQDTSLVDGFDIQEKSDTFVWSVTALNDWLGCRWNFYCTQILKMPDSEAHHFVFGTLIHEVLSDYVMNMRQPDGKTIPLASRKYESPQWVYNRFKEKLLEQSSSFTKNEFELMYKRGTDMLGMFVPDHNWLLECRTEQSIRNIEIQGIPVKLTMDRMDFVDEKEFNCIDYKTGKYRSPDFKPGGKLWRQGVFYQLGAMANIEKEGWFTKKIDFIFLEENKTVSVIPELSDREAVIQELIEADRGLKTMEFFTCDCDGENKFCKLKEDILS